MNIVTDLRIWQNFSDEQRWKNTGFVPTMGNLHEGHASLIRQARKENKRVVVSVFVNPAQFNNPQDLASYPRTLDSDLAMLESLKIDDVLLPDVEALYPDNYEIQVNETCLSRMLEGEFRPGHFAGMLTVVLKLLNIVMPARVYFGEKDYQQYLLVKKMAASLFLPVEVIACPTVRAEDGLALSSRNSLLTNEERERAACLYQTLCSGGSLKSIEEQLVQQGFRVEYVEEQWGRRLAAVWLGNVRLIDNVGLEKDKNAIVS